MKGYVIALRQQLHDADEMATYAEKAAATLPPGARPLVVYGRQETVEGGPVDKAVLIEFPSYDEAMQWYESSAYQQAAAHRFKGADYHVVVVEGLDETGPLSLPTTF